MVRHRMALRFEFSPPAPKKVLLVDDDDGVAELVALLLQQEGYTTVVVSNGSQVLGEAAREKPGLILLDLMIPPLNGYKVLGDLKADPRLKGIPVLLLTALTDRDALDRGLKLGALGVVNKPFRAESLLQALKTYFKA